MIQKKKWRIAFIMALFHMGITSNLLAATIYIDNKLDVSCSGSYSVGARACNGSDGAAYNTIQEAINNCSVGDVIYMRGGTYNEIAIDIPESKNGSAWTSGNYTTLGSYPGEWAIVDGAGLNTNAKWYFQAIFTHPTGYGTGESNNYTAYWVFERFEVTGGRVGFFLKADNIKWRYMYIHDNGRSRGVTDTLVAGILSVCPRYSTIEYCYFKDNIQSPVSDMNNSNILFDSDYKDGVGNGNAFNINAATHHNVVRYNYLVGSRISIRQKEQQRFGYNDRNPNEMTYKEFGDKWHHNIILDASESIGASQDFIQIYNNITDSTINFGRRSGSTGDIPQIYNGVIYNNTVKRDATDSSYGSYTTSGGYDPDFNNYYDNGAQKIIHEHVWFLNNIAANNSSSYHDEPFSFHWNIPENSNMPSQNNANLIVKNNLIYNNKNKNEFVIGHNNDSSYSGCDYQYQTVPSINSCFSAWTGDAQVINWSSSMFGLFMGSTGSAQYAINTDFSLGGTKLAGTVGIGISHPYLSKVMPIYVGAVSPNDNFWVESILQNVSSIAWLKEQGDGDPSWIEGSGQVSSVPSKIQDFQIETGQ
ncbi:MAG: hypothetical protein H8D87_13315 [Deltaproteobacteria bacterium]|uniref:hypothetical protein n=1 Tax=Desulfobacula sp. TaxID=2593537 RepID=UPI0019C2A12B|nr:hypothetical protein [Candidatus Desulfobacula maris]MBL6992765.1 hypothetical protein [Desulfobacula sp.]